MGGQNGLSGRGVERAERATAHGVLVVERPPVQEVDVVSAVHARAGPHRDLLVGPLGVEVSHSDGVDRVAREVEKRRKERHRGHDAALGLFAPGVFTAKLELGVAALVHEARPEGYDVRSASRASLEVRGRRDTSVRAELEVTFVASRGSGHVRRRSIRRQTLPRCRRCRRRGAAMAFDGLDPRVVRGRRACRTRRCRGSSGVDGFYPRVVRGLCRLCRCRRRLGECRQREERRRDERRNEDQRAMGKTRHGRRN